MTPCINTLWTKTGVLQKLPANGLNISLVTQVSVFLFCDKLHSLSEFPCDRLSAHLTVLARMLNCGLPTADFDCRTLFQ